MTNDKIVIKGAREHNLKNIDVTLPRNKLIVMTGLSGSGKSSLAFDTIYADGQRRYMESLSSYARQFLGQMEKPNVDEITGLSPAISIDQKTTSKNPRSTVGTVTEIYDYLRLLYARIGVPHCPVCHRPISQQTVDQMVDEIRKLPAGTRFQVLAPVIRSKVGDYTTQAFFNALIPVSIIISIALTALAVIGIWEKDRPEYFGLGSKAQQKVKVSEYLSIIRSNEPLQRLMVAGAGCKLALAIATNTAVLCMLYGGMMGNYDSLYLPMMIMGYVFSAPFFVLTVRTSQKQGQRASLMRYVSVALVMYVAVLVLLILWSPDNPAFHLSLFTDGKLSINLYTILFVLFFGIGYGAYYATADMPIPMVADCSDYETYRTGNFVPGIIGTLFSLVDKLVSSLSSSVVGLAAAAIGFTAALPGGDDPFRPGMNWVVIILFCIIPMVAWAATLIAMKGYTLTGERMKEIQAVNAARKHAIDNGMSVEEAMKKWVTIDQVPEEFRN